MPWFKVDDGFHGHPKVLELSLPAVGLWTLAGSWCAKYLTDGVIGQRAISRLGGGVDEAAELVEAGLWGRTDDGEYVFNDWSDYQPLREVVEAERDAARGRMQAVRARKKGVSSGERSQSVRANNTGTFGRSSEEVRVTPTRPDPSLNTPANANIATDAEFAEWYNAYPRKKDKGHARKAFTAARKKTDLPTLLEGAKRYATETAGQEQRFLAYPATWLNGERWDDETTTTGAGRVFSPWNPDYHK